MFTTGSKLLIGAATLATISAIAYGVTQNGVMGTIGLTSAAIVLWFIAIVNLFIRDSNYWADEIASIEAAPAAVPAPDNSVWPFAFAFAAAVLTIGLVTYQAVFVIGLVLLLVTGAEWTAEAWAQRASADAAHNAEVRNRIANPLEFPLAAAIGSAWSCTPSAGSCSGCPRPTRSWRSPCSARSSSRWRSSSPIGPARSPARRRGHRGRCARPDRRRSGGRSEWRARHLDARDHLGPLRGGCRHLHQPRRVRGRREGFAERRRRCGGRRHHHPEPGRVAELRTNGPSPTGAMPSRCRGPIRTTSSSEQRRRATTVVHQPRHPSVGRTGQRGRGAPVLPVHRARRRRRRGEHHVHVALPSITAPDGTSFRARCRFRPPESECAVSNPRSKRHP